MSTRLAAAINWGGVVSPWWRSSRAPLTTKDRCKRRFHRNEGSSGPFQSAKLLKAMPDKLVAKELPPKPASPPQREQRWCEERLICCLGGRIYKCFECEKVFSRHHLLAQRKTTHSTTAGRETCQRCGLVVLKRNIHCKRHRETMSCKSKVG